MSFIMFTVLFSFSSFLRCRKCSSKEEILNQLKLHVSELYDEYGVLLVLYSLILTKVTHIIYWQWFKVIWSRIKCGMVRRELHRFWFMNNIDKSAVRNVNLECLSVCILLVLISVNICYFWNYIYQWFIKWLLVSLLFLYLY